MVEQAPLDTFEEHEKDHGRHSSWYVSVFDASNRAKAKEWKNLKRYIHVHKITTKKGKDNQYKEIHSDRLYISDQFKTDAEFFHHGIRNHWSIENSLHWVKDVVHKEDKNQITKDNGPVNAAVFSSITINVHRASGTKSLTDAHFNFLTDIKQHFQDFKQRVGKFFGKKYDSS